LLDDALDNLKKMKIIEEINSEDMYQTTGT